MFQGLPVLLKEVFRAKDRMLVESAEFFNIFRTTYPQMQVNSIYLNIPSVIIEESIDLGSH